MRLGRWLNRTGAIGNAPGLVERTLEVGADSLCAVGQVVDYGWLLPFKRNLRDDQVHAAL